MKWIRFPCDNWHEPVRFVWNSNLQCSLESGLVSIPTNSHVSSQYFQCYGQGILEKLNRDEHIQILHVRSCLLCRCKRPISRSNCCGFVPSPLLPSPHITHHQPTHPHTHTPTIKPPPPTPPPPNPFSLHISHPPPNPPPPSPRTLLPPGQARPGQVRSGQVRSLEVGWSTSFKNNASRCNMVLFFWWRSFFRYRWWHWFEPQ